MTMKETNARASLAERIASANAARERAACSVPDRELLEAQRRAPFEVCDLYRVHAEELLQITGPIFDALPSRAAYLARTDPQAAACPENQSVKAHAEVENPACVFVWEVRHNQDGALATSPDSEYSVALDATDQLKDLWENKPALNELQLVKALITQIVLFDDDLRDEVFRRADVLARECAAAVAPYLRPQS